MPSLTIATQKRKQCSVYLWRWRSCSEVNTEDEEFSEIA